MKSAFATTHHGTNVNELEKIADELQRDLDWGGGIDRATIAGRVARAAEAACATEEEEEKRDRSEGPPPNEGEWCPICAWPLDSHNFMPRGCGARKGNP